MSATAAAVLNILSSTLPSFATDIVAVYTQDYTQVFRDARAIKAVVKETSKVMEHPIETGAIVTDHRIVLPVEIDLNLILIPATYRDVYYEIRDLYLQGTLLIVQTRSGIYENQLINSMPHEEDPSIYDTITIALSLKQVQMVTAQFTTQPRSPKNTSTVARGNQQGKPANSNQASIAEDAFTNVKSYFGGSS